jgi:tetratricopeptide (TPR) repeat protein
MWSFFARQELLKGNFTGAVSLYQRCAEYDPCDGRAWLGLSRIYWKKGDHLMAEKMFKDGLYYGPKNPFLLQGWAVMLEKQGRNPQAMKLLLTSVKTNPKHAASWVALARLHQREGKVDEARLVN